MDSFGLGLKGGTTKQRTVIKWAVSQLPAYPFPGYISCSDTHLSASEPNTTFAGKKAAAPVKSEAVQPGTDPVI